MHVAVLTSIVYTEAKKRVTFFRWNKTLIYRYIFLCFTNSYDMKSFSRNKPEHFFDERFKFCKNKIDIIDTYTAHTPLEISRMQFNYNVVLFSKHNLDIFLVFWNFKQPYRKGSLFLFIIVPVCIFRLLKIIFANRRCKCVKLIICALVLKLPCIVQSTNLYIFQKHFALKFCHSHGFIIWNIYFLQ